MRFGKRVGTLEGEGLSQEGPSQEGPSQEGYLPSEGESDRGVDLYVERRSSLGPRLLIPHLFLSSLYVPLRARNYYNKKADNRDNVFMHFG